MDRAEYHVRCFLEEVEHEEAYFYLGLVQNSQGKWEEALHSYYKAVSINHEYGNPCNEIGVVLLRMGKDRDAIYWLKKSIRCAQNDALHISYFNLATLYKLWNRPERSLQYLHKAMEIKKDFPEAWKMWESLQEGSNPSTNSN
ncbi:tetratricopeptide repeat protein [Leptospira ryugenii]|uniref:Tetratricopeptide repeat protein n=1 Tax=Leptospira ryugenii TaxID=1917863 RepID=A0A2P2E1E9_9LEPT|nr:tetratricopeptide repeat protein [Leptospira ryugenii]